MFCTNCGKELVEGARFCVNCGTAVDGAETEGHGGEDPTRFDGFDVSAYEVSSADKPKAQSAANDRLNVAPTVKIDPVAGAVAPIAGRSVQAPPMRPAGSAQQPQAGGRESSGKRFPLGLIALAFALAMAAAFASYFIFTNVVSSGGQDQPAATEQIATEAAEQDGAQPAAGAGKQTEQEAGGQASTGTGGSAASSSSTGNASSNTGNASSNTSSASANTATSSGDYVLADSNTRYYSRSELEAMSNETLFHARNEIYARHGRQFKNADLQSFFGSKSWYNGTIAPDSFDDSVFNDFERKNADLMRTIEEERNSPYLK